jgi:hypothetical protein
MDVFCAGPDGPVLRPVLTGKLLLAPLQAASV